MAKIATQNNGDAIVLRCGEKQYEQIF